jgi:hypothetical protein
VCRKEEEAQRTEYSQELDSRVLLVHRLDHLGLLMRCESWER